MKEYRTVMGKPSIPVEFPKRRGVPDMPHPMTPRRLPTPAQPTRTITAPQEPVPAGR